MHRSGEILIAGLGSVGRRHLANLRALGWTNVRLFRTGRSTLPDADLAGLPVEHDLDAALERRPLAVVVANPSALHVPTALAAARTGAHLLIEKPISHTLAGVLELQDTVARRQLTALVGFQFRFHPGLRRIKAWIDGGAIGAVVSAHVHWGEALPLMHPWEDYRIGYAARAELGGGVLLTLCHPFDYLRWLLGEVDRVTAIEHRDDTLGLNVDVSVDVSLRFARGCSGFVHLDFLQQPPGHRLEIVGTDGRISWSQRDHTARCFSNRTGRCEAAPPPEGFERNWMFLDEMRHFLACLRGEAQPVCTLRDGRDALAVTLAARRAIADRLIDAEAS